MRIRNLDLIGAMCFAMLGMGWVLLFSRPLLVGMMLAVPLVFMLPGYTLTRLLFCRQPADPLSASSNNLILQPRLKISQPFNAIDHMILSLGLSLVIDIITGFFLNVTPMGLQRQSWMLSLGLVTVVFALLAVGLRRRQPVKKNGKARWHISLKECVLLGSALVIAAAAFWFSMIRPPQPQPSFTQFWMLPSTQANKSCAVFIGMRSFELAPVTYRIQVTSNGRQVASWPSIMLTTQQRWNQLVSVSPTAVGAVVDARLYRLDQPGTIYREVHVTLHSCGSAAAAATLHLSTLSPSLSQAVK